MANWDLQAVVRGYSDGFNAKEIPSSVFQLPHKTSLHFPDNFEPIITDDHLENLFEPFCPNSNSNIPFSTQTDITSSFSVPQDVEEQEKMEITQQTVYNSNVVLKTRKRKNQQNRVVQHVTADGLLADTWAWRKYGQKPIKGSPYPRSYYRCSSSKGCLARKQVERCFWDPQTFILTYTAEHDHDQPTRRSSLAGTTRNKPCAAKCGTFYEPHVPTGPILSLTTPENRSLGHGNLKREEEEQQVSGDCEGNKIFAQDLMSSDEFFRTLEDLEGILLGQFPM